MRQAVRGLLWTPQQELLLMQIAKPDTDECLWIAPGGGIEAGESPAESLQRELYEETGLSDVEIGPEVWVRQHRFAWGERWMEQQELYCLVPTERFEPKALLLEEGAEKDSFRGFRWWTLAEIEASTALFVPRRLGFWMRKLSTEGPPPALLDVGI